MPAARAARDRGRDRGGVVVAAERAQQAIVEGLRAQRQPVARRRAQRAQVRLVDLAGVGLDGDLERLGVGRRRTRAQAASITRASASGAPEAGRAAAEVDRRSAPGAREPGAARGDLGDDRVGVGVVRDLGAHLDGEVAVRAVHAAEREVDVDAERHARRERAARRI